MSSFLTPASGQQKKTQTTQPVSPVPTTGNPLTPQPAVQQPAQPTTKTTQLQPAPWQTTPAPATPALPTQPVGGGKQPATTQPVPQPVQPDQYNAQALSTALQQTTQASAPKPAATVSASGTVTPTMTQAATAPVGGTKQPATTNSGTLPVGGTNTGQTTNTYDPNNPTAGLQGGEVYGNWTYTVSPITGLKQWVNNTTGETMGMSIDPQTGMYTMQTPPEVLAMLQAAGTQVPDATLPTIDPNPTLPPPNDTSTTTPIATSTPPTGWTLSIQGENGNLSVWTGPDGKTYWGNEPWNDPSATPIQDVPVSDGSVLTGPPLGEGTIPIPAQPEPVISPIDTHFGEIENPNPIDPGGYGTPIPGVTPPVAPPGGTPIVYPPGTTGGGSLGSTDYLDEYRKMQEETDKRVSDQYASIEKALQDSLQSQFGDISLQQSLNARRSNEMNALTGGGAYGGAQAAGQTQAQLGGQQMRLNAMTDVNKRTVAAKQAYLQMLADRAAQQERLATTAEEARRAREQQIILQQMMGSYDIANTALGNAGDSALTGTDITNLLAQLGTTVPGYKGTP